MNIGLTALFLACCGAAAVTGVVFQPGDWYLALNRPGWTPPNAAFPIAWTIIYICIAIAAARIAPLPAAGVAIGLWALQIALNVLWTPVFFGAHRIGLGLAIIVLLWLVVTACTVVFWRMDRLAGALMLPYLAWLSLAAPLNAWIWQNNPAA